MDFLLQEAVDLLNNKGTKQNGLEWSVLDYNYHFTNDVAINQILQRLIFIFTENHPSKDIFTRDYYFTKLCGFGLLFYEIKCMSVLYLSRNYYIR